MMHPGKADILMLKFMGKANTLITKAKERLKRCRREYAPLQDDGVDDGNANKILLSKR